MRKQQSANSQCVRCDSHVVHQLRSDASVHVEKIFTSSLGDKGHSHTCVMIFYVLA